jgi:site-specific DNA recombinase
VVYPDRIEVEVDKLSLRSALAGEVQSAKGLDIRRVAGGDVIRLAINTQLKRFGGEMRLVLPPDVGERTAQPASSLVKAVVRAQTWRRWILAGEVSGRRSIAKRAGLDERYLGRVLECAFLAPDIVEAILDGRQPPELTFAKLTGGLPLNWIEQRTQLGFPSIRLEKTAWNLFPVPGPY